MIGDAGEHVTQTSFQVYTVELGGFDERVYGGGPPATGVGASKEPVLAAQRYAADRTLGGIVVDLDAAIVEVARQGISTVQRIAHGGGAAGFAGEFWQGGFDPRLEFAEQWQGLLFAASLPLIERFAPHAALDAVEGADAFKRLFGKR